MLGFLFGVGSSFSLLVAGRGFTLCLLELSGVLGIEVALRGNLSFAILCLREDQSEQDMCMGQLIMSQSEMFRII